MIRFVCGSHVLVFVSSAVVVVYSYFFFQAEDGIRDLVRSRGLGDVYKRQELKRHGFRSASGIVVGRKGRRFLTFGGSEHVLVLSLIHI